MSPRPIRRRLKFDWNTSRTELLVLLLSLIAALILVPYAVNFDHRNDAERPQPRYLPFWQQMETWEYSLYDARFTARGAQTPETLDKIAIVGIDDNSLALLGEWPLSRRRHAQLIERLNRAGARVIAFDFDFSSRQNPQDDAAFAAAIKRAGNVVLGSDLTVSVRSGQDGEPIIEYRAVTPLEEFDMLTPDLAFFTVPRDPDGSARRYPQRIIVNDTQVGSLAALATGLYQGLVDNRENQAYELALETGLWPTLDKKTEAVPRALSRPANADAPRIWSTPIYFYGPPRTFPIYSYASVLQGRSGEYSDAALREKFEGRIVFVGATATILKDTFPVPHFAGDSEIVTPQIAGVELHATAAAMLMEGRYIETASMEVTLILLFGLTLATGAWIIALRRPVNYLARRAQLLAAQRGTGSGWHALVWFGSYALLGMAPIFLFWEAVKWAFEHYAWWIIAVYPVAGAMLGGLSVLLLMFTLETAERRKTVTQMGRFMSAGVLREVLAHPEEDYPRPRRRPATILFTDLQGFTPYSESHEPEEVVEALNAYMTRMVPILEDHGGEVDKYIGDAIMAFFGVPVPRADHAEQALRCAVAMQQECARFRKETGIPFYMRIGIHTGDVIAGSVGSVGTENHQPRINYTVIGDTVNVAARLEGKNKDLGSWVLCSAETYEAAPDVANGERVLVEVKGKSESFYAYKVRGLAGESPQEMRWGPQSG